MRITLIRYSSTQAEVCITRHLRGLMQNQKSVSAQSSLQAVHSW